MSFRPRAVAALAVVSMLLSAPLRADERVTIAPPIDLKLSKHERALFNWNPDFQLNVPNFGPGNRPFIRSRGDGRDETGFVHVLEDGQWERRDFLAAVRKAHPDFLATDRAGGWNGAEVAFDAAGDAYTVVSIRTKGGGAKNLLLHSRDACRSWAVHDLPAGTLSMEHTARPEPLPGPPALIVISNKREHPARWADQYDLALVVPRKGADGALEVGPPRLISGNCFGISQHSGGAPMVATRGGRIYVVWGEIADELVKEKTPPGAPTYVAAFDLAGEPVGEKVFIAHAPPVNDAHNAPGVVADSKGYLHVITGAHGANFWYSRSNKPDDIAGGWSKLAPTVTTGWKEGGKERGRQTYLAMVCDADDTLHIAYRHWIKGDGRFPKEKDGQDSYYAALSYQRKPRGGAWSKPTILVAAPMAGYGIYYHKLAIDQGGRLFLSYGYYNQTEGGPYISLDGSKLHRFRAMLASDDGGKRWILPDTEFFESGIEKE